MLSVEEGGSPWVEPRSPREHELQLRLLRTQKELQRTRTELARRVETQRDRHAKEEEGKPDWCVRRR